MKAIILAAGEGLRCRPLTLTRSKVMLPVANRPILEHVISSLEKNEIKEIILVVGYEKERIMNYFEDGLNFGVNISYVEQKAQLGTAHDVRQALAARADGGHVHLVVRRQLAGDHLRRVRFLLRARKRAVGRGGRRGGQKRPSGQTLVFHASASLCRGFGGTTANA